MTTTEIQKHITNMRKNATAIKKETKDQRIKKYLSYFFQSCKATKERIAISKEIPGNTSYLSFYEETKNWYDSILEQHLNESNPNQETETGVPKKYEKSTYIQNPTFETKIPESNGQISLKLSRGGKREGAGRKPIGITKKVSISLPENEWKEIEKIIEEKRAASISEYFRKLHNENKRTLL